MSTITLEPGKVLDLGEDGEQWCMSGHLDAADAREAVRQHLVEVGDLEGSREAENYPVRHVRGGFHATYVPELGHEVDAFVKYPDGPLWTFVDWR